ncbi:MAG: hypothetical protein ABI461_03445 [Polyangiaceae bacterium]
MDPRMIFSNLKRMVLLGSASAIFSVACDEGTIPVFPPKTDAGTVTTDGGDASVVRTVETRNPLGDTANPTNLMVDGDFELTGRSEQMPWITFTNSGQGTLDYATGGLCKSGVRCASLPTGTDLVGYFASPKAGTMVASIFAKPDTGNCNDVQITAIDLNDQATGGQTPLRSSSQDANGWCTYGATIPNMADKQPVLYISVAGGTALIDDGVILPSTSINPITHSNVKMSSVMRERVRFIADWIRAHRRF